MSSIPTVFILTGLPFSGKTTLAKAIVNKRGFKIVSMDDIMSKNHLNPDTMTQEDWNMVYSEGYRQLKEYLSNKVSVVLDCGNLLKHERETPKRIAESVGANYKLIYLNQSKQEVSNRRIINQTTQERDDLTDKTMNTALNMFEEPTIDENPIIFNQQMDLKSWIENNI